MPSLQTELLSADAGLARLREQQSRINAQSPQRVHAFYSSVLGGITLDPALFAIGIDDHLVTRGHGVFDTCNVIGSQVYGLSFHLDRILSSARKARISLARASFMPPDVPDNEEAQDAAAKSALLRIILDTIAASGQSDAYCRFWLSACRGDFAVTLTALAASAGANLFVVVHGQAPRSPGADGTQCPIVHDSTVSVPPRIPLLATMKSTNYLVNALAAMEAQAHTGRTDSLGLQVDSEGYVTEFSIAAVAIVTADNVLQTPHQYRVLASTTLARAFDLARAELLPRGVLAGVEFADITLEDMAAAKEVLRLGGGGIAAVVNLDGADVGDGRAGPVAQTLHALLRAEQASSRFLHTPPYRDFAAKL